MKISRISCTWLLVMAGSLAINSDSQAVSARPVGSSTTLDVLAPRYESTLVQGIDFAREGYPSFLEKVTGVSQHETWGRWTDAKEATIKFKQKLPEKFTLELIAQAFGPNINNPLTVKVGKAIKEITITTGVPGNYELSFEGINSDSLTLVPAKPTTPKSIGVNEDTRLLGIGLIKLKFR